MIKNIYDLYIYMAVLRDSYRDEEALEQFSEEYLKGSIETIGKIMEEIDSDWVKKSIRKRNILYAIPDMLQRIKTKITLKKIKNDCSKLDPDDLPF